jgi:putative transposase
MPRIARIVIPEVAYHVTQRGNNRQDVFFADDDRRVYLDFLAGYAREFGLKMLGYCLMTNHLHLVAVPGSADSLARVIGRTGLRYTQYINRFHRRSGHLWQNRFYSCALDEKHTVAALRYIEQNPVRARVTRTPWTYEWSSAPAHIVGRDPSGLLDMDAWRTDWSPAEWRRLLKSGLDQRSVETIRRHTARGRPLGSDGFLAKVERLVGRRVRALPVGRPKGWRKRSKSRTK